MAAHVCLDDHGAGVLPPGRPKVKAGEFTAFAIRWAEATPELLAAKRYPLAFSGRTGTGCSLGRAVCLRPRWEELARPVPLAESLNAAAPSQPARVVGGTSVDLPAPVSRAGPPVGRYNSTALRQALAAAQHVLRRPRRAISHAELAASPFLTDGGRQLPPRLPRVGAHICHPPSAERQRSHLA